MYTVNVCRYYIRALDTLSSRYLSCVFVRAVVRVRVHVGACVCYYVLFANDDVQLRVGHMQYIMCC